MPIYISIPASLPRGSIRANPGYAASDNSYRGRLVKDRDTGEPRLTIRNYEAGVILALPAKRALGRSPNQVLNDESDRDSPRSSNAAPNGLPKVAAKAASRTAEDATMLDSFRAMIPVPLQVPGAELVSPWFFREG